MGQYTRSRDLDAWAIALGVGDDDAAMGELHKLMGRVLDGQDRVRRIARSLSAAPKGETQTLLATALGKLDLMVVALSEALRGFAVHERGRS